MKNKNNNESFSRNNAKIDNLKNLLNLDLTQQLRIKVLTFINTAIALNTQCSATAERYIALHYDMFMTLSKIIKDKEAIGVDALKQALTVPSLPLFTDISHDRAIAEWDFFLNDVEDEKNGNSRKKKNMFKNF